MLNPLSSHNIDVSFCIVNWNTRELTSQLVASIYRTVGALSHEVLVVDNASKDNSVVFLSQHHPEIILIQNTLNPGYGAALNQAIRRASGRFIMLLNSDVILLDNAIKHLVSALESHPDAGAVGPVCISSKGEIDFSYGYFPQPLKLIVAALLGSLTPRALCPPPIEDKPSGRVPTVMNVEYIKGACLLVKASTFDEVGCFDERFFAYYEETDFCYRLHQKHVRRLLTLSATVVHLGDSSFSQISTKKNAIFQKSKRTYLRKHHGILVFAAYCCADAWATFRSQLKATLLGVFGRS